MTECFLKQRLLKLPHYYLLMMAYLLCLSCDTRKPLQNSSLLPAGMEFIGDSVVTYADSLTVPLMVILLNDDRGIMDTGTVYFSAHFGMISGKVNIDNSVAQAQYFPGKYDVTVKDIIRAYVVNKDGSDTLWSIWYITVFPGTEKKTKEIGSILLSTSNPFTQVRSAGGRDQSIISARVLDVFGNPIYDGFPVTFDILSGPGGGENINELGRSDTASTVGGAARVTFNSGTRIGVVEIRAQAGRVSVQQGLLTISAGPPENIDIDALENSTVREGGRWKMKLHAILTDKYLNPVRDSTSALFTLNTVKTDSSKVSIRNSALTEVKLDNKLDSIPGVAVTWLSFDSEVIFDSLGVLASTTANNTIINRATWITLPLPAIQPTAEFFGGGVRVSSDTAVIYGEMRDAENFPIRNARLCINTEVGTVLDTLTVEKGCGKTNGQGTVTFLIVFKYHDQKNGLVPIQTNVVTITEPVHSLKAETSLQIKF